MKILITGGCGFVGSNLIIHLKKHLKKSKLFSLDNLFRKGSRINEKRLKKIGVKNFKLDISNFYNIKKLPKVDLVVDCCAEPSIEASKKDSDRVIYTNFIGTYNVLKKCVKDDANIIFLSTSRVYSIRKIKSLFKKSKKFKNLRKLKINEKFNTSGIKSIYGLTKYFSEELIKEFNYCYGIKYVINRFGVIAGPWQFGKQDQGFVSLWVARHMLKKNLSYIGFGGKGQQLRDIIHIDDVCEILLKQIKSLNKINNNTFNIGGGPKNTISLKNLTNVCKKIIKNKVKFSKIKKTSNYDIPFYMTDNNKIKKNYNWTPKKNIKDIVNDIYNWLNNNKSILNLYK